MNEGRGGAGRGGAGRGGAGRGGAGRGGAELGCVDVWVELVCSSVGALVRDHASVVSGTCWRTVALITPVSQY